MFFYVFILCWNWINLLIHPFRTTLTSTHIDGLHAPKALYFLKHWLGMIIFTENANIMLWWNSRLIFQIKVNFLNCGRDITSISHNNSINLNGWQARYLCLWAPGAVSQTRCKLNCRNCPTNILNPRPSLVRFQVFEEEKINFPLYS